MTEHLKFQRVLFLKAQQTQCEVVETGGHLPECIVTGRVRQHRPRAAFQLYEHTHQRCMVAHIHHPSFDRPLLCRQGKPHQQQGE